MIFICLIYLVSVDPDMDVKHVIYFNHKIFLEIMTNHPEIKKYSIIEDFGIFEKTHAYRSFEQILEVSRNIEKLMKHSRINKYSV